jgi:hypothetical protein
MIEARRVPTFEPWLVAADQPHVTGLHLQSAPLWACTEASPPLVIIYCIQCSRELRRFDMSSQTAGGSGMLQKSCAELENVGNWSVGEMREFTVVGCCMADVVVLCRWRYLGFRC